jgi:hypothetical protein
VKKVDPNDPPTDTREFIELNRAELEEVAQLALYRGADPAESMLYLFEVESPWRRVIDRLKPGANLQPFIEAAHATPNGTAMVVGWCPRSQLIEIMREWPGINIAPALQDPPLPPGTVWVAIGHQTADVTPFALGHITFRDASSRRRRGPVS